MNENIVTSALPILSWNIHDANDRIEAPKTDDNDFIEILNSVEFSACRKQNKISPSQTTSALTA